MEKFTKKELEIALRESLILQAHYANLLNIYDGGERKIFKTEKEWINRLKEIGDIEGKLKVLKNGNRKTKNNS